MPVHNMLGNFYPGYLTTLQHRKGLQPGKTVRAAAGLLTPATGANPPGERKDRKMGKSRRRLCWDNAVRVLKQLLGLAGELVSLINAIRRIR
jgi:hypothetical protein